MLFALRHEQAQHSDSGNPSSGTCRFTDRPQAACIAEMAVQRLVRWAAWQGEKRSDAQWQREHLQRRQAAHIASKASSDFSFTGH